MGPFFAAVGQRAVGPDCEDRDAVVQAVAGVEELSVGGDQQLGAEVASGETLWKRGDRLTRLESTGVGVAVEEGDGRAFLLDAIEPLTGWVEGEVAWAVAGRKRDAGAW